MLLLAAVGLFVLASIVVLPVLAWIRTRELETRLAGVEAALSRLLRERRAAETPPAEHAPQQPSESLPATSSLPKGETPPVVTPAPAAAAVAAPPTPSASLETVVGQKWLGWAAVLLIFLAAAFFLKYAFENRWIGELGRVTLGVLAGVLFTWLGLERHRRGWRYLSQILTVGGITLLYLSTYGAFGYYHLIDSRAAFVFMAILVAEACLLASVYNAPAIASMALLGGFLVPVLLSTGRDQYRVLFTYLVALDVGVLGLVITRRWRWIGSIAFAGTQLLFWLWYGEHYHPEKRAAVLAFQATVFLVFLMADLAPHLRKRAPGAEEWIRLITNAFVFYATCYSLLESDHRDWMGAFALLMAIAYAALARLELALRPAAPRMVLVTLGTALTFVTLAIPIQLESNWITIGWSVEALVLLWASFETGVPRLRELSAAVFVLALIRFLFWDAPWGSRPTFTPVLNRYFLGMLVVAVCLARAAHLCRRHLPGATLVPALVAVGVLWIGCSVETYSYFDSQASAVTHNAGYGEHARQLRWAGQMALSILWSVFAAALTASGFRLKLGALRLAGLALFGLTLVKVVFLDISELRQFYRIVALLALGLVLLWAAWTYQRVLRREQAK